MRNTESTLDNSSPPSQNLRNAPEQAELKPISRGAAVDVPRQDGWRASQLDEVSPGYRRSLFRR